MKVSYLLLTFLNNGIQAMQQAWKKYVNHKKNKSHLVTFHMSILVRIQTFQLTFVFRYIHFMYSYIHKILVYIYIYIYIYIVRPAPTPLCSSYWKESLQVTAD